MIVSPSELEHKDLYGLLLNSVAPRPIAWISTVSASGQPNLAPFSFFNVVSVNPPLLGFSPGLRQSRLGASRGEAKDTLQNIRETKEFVVNVVTYAAYRRLTALKVMEGMGITGLGFGDPIEWERTI